ncbi:MAG: hypothetical protein V1886_01200 [archaeon]
MYPDLAVYRSMSGSTKDQILNILSYDWPLSIKKIYSFLKKRYSRNVTYQAAYKAINQMLQEKILVKAKEGYQLNLGWVKEIHNQTEIIRANYFSEQHAVLFDKDSGDTDAIRAFIFKTWFDVEKYLYYLQKSYVLKSKNKETICVHHSHEWLPLFYLRAEYNWVKQLNKLGHRIFTLCSGNSVIDRWAADFYRSIGGNIQLGEKCAETCEIMVFSDLVIQLYIPLELGESLDKEFRKINRIENVNYASLIKNVFEKETEIKVVVNKDKNLASQIKKQTLAKFRI